jgi:CHAD domain-containing protein
MSDDAPLTPRPAAEGARVLALRYLDEAAQAAPRLNDHEDLEALHDFRVGLRRLRSVLKAYKTELDSSVRKKDGKRIAEIARSTNEGRDAEVQLIWLEKQRAKSGTKTRPGLDWLVARVTERMHAGYRAARSEMLHHFAKADKVLRERLKHYELQVELGSAPRVVTFAESTSTLIATQLADITAHHALIRDASDEPNIHETRIAAKRLRYVLEPLKGENPRVGPIVKRLKELQDVLGELHDMHVMTATLAEAIETAATERARSMYALSVAGTSARTNKRDERDGLLWLTELARTERDALFAKSWSADELQKFVAEVEAIAAGLVKSGVEIERKYLLKSMPKEALKFPFQELDQGYIPGDRLIERVRHVRENKRDRYFRTIKFGHGVTRTEIEEETSPQVFKALWAATVGKRLQKRRYMIEANGFVWELDVFKKRKLVLLEVELPSEDTVATPPEWLAKLIVRDVTDEPAYLNLNLTS